MTARLIVGGDPSVTAAGVAVLDLHALDRRGLPSLARLDAVPFANRRRGYDRLRDGIPRMRAMWGVEKMPTKLPEEANPTHTSGAAVGFATAMFHAVAFERGEDVEEVSSRTWRATCRRILPPGRGRTATRSRVERIERTDVPAMVDVVYQCGHRRRVARATASLVVPCEECRPLTGWKAKRDRRKAWAVRLARLLYPEQVGRFIDAARSRARNKAQPDHTLSGVSDASEALCVAVHVTVAVGAVTVGQWVANIKGGGIV